MGVTTATLAGQWRSRLWLAPVFLVVLAFVYGPILADLVVDWWTDPNYAHGFLVPLLSFMFLRRKRAALAGARLLESWTGLPLLLLGLIMLVGGNLAAELFLQRTSLILVLSGLTLMLLGPEVFRRSRFPLGFLVFAIPLPYIIFYPVTSALQGVAAANAAWVLDLLGVPVLLDQNVLHLAFGSLGVSEACSGIRSLISLLALATALAYLRLTGFWAQALLIALAVPIAIFANSVRVVFSGLFGLWFGAETAQGFMHTMSGLLLFIFAMVLLSGPFLIIEKLQRRRAARATA